MGLFDDINQFLEERLDEFLQDNPHLELQAIEEQLREQERDTQKIITEFQLKEKRLQEEILAIATDIQTWHGRITKAQTGGREDLAKAAREREAALLRQGNQLWGQMEGVKESIVKARELLGQIQQKRQDTQAKYEQVRDNQFNTTSQSGSSVGWDRGANTNNYNRAADPLDAEFQKWELDEEIERMKRKS
jgi:uncharacterized protein (TIGR04376 family)